MTEVCGISQILAPLERQLDRLADKQNDDAHRLLHGRGRCYEGLEQLTVDWIAPLIWAVLYKPLDPALEEALRESLGRHADQLGCAAMLQRRYEKGAPAELLAGAMPETLNARESDLQFHVQPGRNQNIGYFMDLSPARDWLRERCEGGRVLNLFAFTCANSVAAAQAGAERVVNVDMSRAAMRIGADNHRLNELGDGLRGRKAEQNSEAATDVVMLDYDLFRSWKAVRKFGRYDQIIIDPPSRQKGSFEAEKDYPRVLRQLPSLLNEGGEFLACLNAPYLPESFLRDMIAAELPEAEFVQRLKNREDFPEADSDAGLKMLHYRWR